MELILYSLLKFIQLMCKWSGQARIITARQQQSRLPPAYSNFVREKYRQSTTACSS